MTLLHVSSVTQRQACADVPAVTTTEMRVFARDCSHWVEQASNPSDRETILGAARRWTRIATQIEGRVDEGWELACADLRSKLD
jgi:hypothetical protein